MLTFQRRLESYSQQVIKGLVPSCGITVKMEGGRESQENKFNEHLGQFFSQIHERPNFLNPWTLTFQKNSKKNKNITRSRGKRLPLHRRGQSGEYFVVGYKVAALAMWPQIFFYSKGSNINLTGFQESYFIPKCQ